MRLNEVAKKLKCSRCKRTDYNDIRCGLCDKCAFEEVAQLSLEALNEAAYKGNVGAMEMFKFYQVASEQQKALMAKLIKEKLFDKAWELLKQVTGVQLQ